MEIRFQVDYFHEENYLISFTKNISADGMFIHTPQPPAVGTFLQLVFSIGDLHEVTVGARVVWTSRANGESEPGMGVRFLDPPGFVREALLSLVQRIAVLAETVSSTTPAGSDQTVQDRGKSRRREGTRSRDN